MAITLLSSCSSTAIPELSGILCCVQSGFVGVSSRCTMHGCLCREPEQQWTREQVGPGRFCKALPAPYHKGQK